jgi:hypothetical protein
MKYLTESGREISFLGAGTREDIDEFFGVLLKSWIKRDDEYDFSNDPAHNQCTVTAMVVQDYFGGEILALAMPGGGTHYLNLIDEKVFDLTSDQFTSHGVELDYSGVKVVPRSSVGTDGTAPERYRDLKANVELYMAAK